MDKLHFAAFFIIVFSIVTNVHVLGLFVHGSSKKRTFENVFTEYLEADLIKEYQTVSNFYIYYIE